MYSTLMQWNNYWRSRWLAASSGIYCIASGPVASRHEALVATSGVPAMAADTLGMARIEETDWKKPLLRCLQVPCDKACLHSSSALCPHTPLMITAAGDEACNPVRNTVGAYRPVVRMPGSEWRRESVRQLTLQQIPAGQFAVLFNPVHGRPETKVTASCPASLQN